MTTTTRQSIFITVCMIAGIAFLVGDLHRTIIAAVWPFIEAFWNYQTK